MTLVGIAVLTVEGLRANAAAGRSRAEEAGSTRAVRAIALTGGLLLGLSTFQAEFDFGVPQFRLVFQPMLLMLAAGLGLVLARIYGGRGAALGAAGFFIVLRGALALAIGPLLGQTMPALPALHRRGAGGRGDRPAGLDPAAAALRPLGGAGIGTVGLAAEWAWSQAWMPLPWPAAMFPEGALLGFAAAMAGAMIGAWMGSHLTVEPGERRPLLRGAAVCAAAVLRGPRRLRPRHLDRPGDQRARGPARGRPRRRRSRSPGDDRPAAARRGRGGGVVRRHRLAGRRPRRRPSRSGPGPAGTGPRGRSRSTATGRR